MLLEFKLGAVYVGEWRHDRSVVRDKQLSTANPNQLEFWEQFKSQKLTTGTGTASVDPRVKLTFAKGGFIVIDDERSCPNGALIAFKLMVTDQMAWTVATNSKGTRIFACEKEGGELELGRPSRTPDWTRVRRGGLKSWEHCVRILQKLF